MLGFEGVQALHSDVPAGRAHRITTRYNLDAPTLPIDDGLLVGLLRDTSPVCEMEIPVDDLVDEHAIPQAIDDDIPTQRMKI